MDTGWCSLLFTLANHVYFCLYVVNSTVSREQCCLHCVLAGQLPPAIRAAACVESALTCSESEHSVWTQKAMKKYCRLSCGSCLACGARAPWNELRSVIYHLVPPPTVVGHTIADCLWREGCSVMPAGSCGGRSTLGSSVTFKHGIYDYIWPCVRAWHYLLEPRWLDVSPLVRLAVQSAKGHMLVTSPRTDCSSGRCDS